jgi:hypothetical protein
MSPASEPTFPLPLYTLLPRSLLDARPPSSTRLFFHLSTNPYTNHSLLHILNLPLLCIEIRDEQGDRRSRRRYSELAPLIVFIVADDQKSRRKRVGVGCKYREFSRAVILVLSNLWRRSRPVGRSIVKRSGNTSMIDSAERTRGTKKGGTIVHIRRQVQEKASTEFELPQKKRKVRKGNEDEKNTHCTQVSSSLPRIQMVVEDDALTLEHAISLEKKAQDVTGRSIP